MGCNTIFPCILIIEYVYITQLSTEVENNGETVTLSILLVCSVKDFVEYVYVPCLTCKDAVVSDIVDNFNILLFWLINKYPSNSINLPLGKIGDEIY